MATTISTAIADQIITLFTGQTVYLSLHTANPGKTGANLATAVGLLEVLPGDWDAITDDPSTGGRMQAITAKTFGNAEAVETITHFGFWDGPDPQQNTFLGGAELTAPQTTAIGNPVNIPAGGIVVAAAGAGQTPES